MIITENMTKNFTFCFVSTTDYYLGNATISPTIHWSDMISCRRWCSILT